MNDAFIIDALGNVFASLADADRACSVAPEGDDLSHLHAGIDADMNLLKLYTDYLVVVPEGAGDWLYCKECQGMGAMPIHSEDCKHNAFLTRSR